MTMSDAAGPDVTWSTHADELDHWVTAVARHRLWDHVEDDPTDGDGPEDTVTRARHRIAELVVHLGMVRRDGLLALPDDPWQDLGFATRMVDRLAFLVDTMTEGSRLGAEGLRLSADEVAVLLAVPFIYDTLRSSLAGRERAVAPHDLTPSQDATSERAAFERFAQSYSQPYRRALAAVARGNRDAAEEIGWWLLHRWLARQPAASRAEALTDLLGPVAGADGPGPLRPDRLALLLWALRVSPGFLARTDAAARTDGPAQTGVPTGAGRPDALAAVAADGVRERLLGYLLVVARGLAIDVVALPEVVSEHLGIADPVTAAGLRATAAAARWTHRGTALSLEAACDHPAAEVALRSHIDTLNDLFAEIHRAAAADATLAPLRGLPTHVTTDGLQPSVVDGVRAYQSAGVRFRLAEDRVQELLMGEQLYGDPALAIRELYQNALDACRYRQARTEYLRRTRGFADDWTGRIRFEQGIDADGRPYLDCIDNGIGMGVRELSDVFAQAGVRLGDLPEFIEEQAEWARLDPPVQLHPNSRFGIGVLSYFMLADEITVQTCRMERDGTPGPMLRVSIAGPGSLFRIRTLGPGRECGTTIRLHLRSATAVSCVDTLRSVLWVAEFATEARHGSDRHEWQPGELSTATPPMQAASKSGQGVPGAAVVADPAAGVWWCTGTGAILADGLWAGCELTGAVVNLSRDLAPRLSVDRTKILGYRDEDLERLLWQAVDALVAAGPAVLSYDWLAAFAPARPLIADVVFERAIASGYRQWRLGEDTIDASIAGCFLPDTNGPAGPDQVVQWRLTALAAAGRYPKLVTPGPDWAGVVRARPSDALIMSVDIDGAAPWLDPAQIVPLATLVRAARRIGRHPSEIAARLEELGYTVAVGHETVGSDPDDLLFLSRDLDSSRPWLDPRQPVPLPHVLKAAHRSGRPIKEVRARLARLGFEFHPDPESVPLDAFDPTDLVLASRDLDGAFPWLDPSDPVPLLHVVRVAHRVGREVSEVAARLAVLGYRLPAGCEGLHRDEHDLVVLSRDLDQASPWLDPAEPVSPVHLLRCAQRTGRPVTAIAERLSALGYPVGVDATQLSTVEITPDDLVLASRDLNGSPPWLDPTRPVSTLHLLRASERAGVPVTTVTTRLTELGYRLATPAGSVLASSPDAPPDVIVDHLDPDDLVLTSVDLDGAHPWLDPAVPVPPVHLVRASRATGRDVHDITARLTVFGYTVQTRFGEVAVDELTRDDLIIVSQDLDGADPWLKTDEPISLPHLLQAARRLRRPVADIAGRLQQLGYTIQVDSAAISVDDIRPNDLTYASNDLDGTRPWLNHDRPVPMAHVLAGAIKTHQPVRDVVHRLTMMRYAAPDIDVCLPRWRPGGG
ncbi:MAG: hypothetical protein IRY85_04250 [Micromonosporaceae bacterium]|nr:hypothetical protein [Micromonosporaceae bacterium]